MKVRINLHKEGQNALKPWYRIRSYLAKSSIEKNLLNLIFYRVSQINRCAYCLDRHSKILRENGETEQRLYVLDAWREAPFYSGKERAALGWAEALTKIESGIVPNEIYMEAREKFSEGELIDLTMAVIAINSYNRINMAFGSDVALIK